MGTREHYEYAAYVRDMEEWFRGGGHRRWLSIRSRPGPVRAQCTIEVLIRGDEHDHVNMYGAYLDSLKNEGMKLSFTTVHDDKSITVILGTVSKVTIYKESK